MPKELSHWYLADLAIKRLIDCSGPGTPNKNDRILAGVLERNRNTVFLGAVAPDVLFYSIGLKRWQEHIASAESQHQLSVQRGVAHVLSSLHQVNPKNEILFAVAFGWLCHIHADEVFHPAVEWYSQGRDGKELSWKHREFESSLDLFLLERSYQLPPEARGKPESIPRTLDEVLTGMGEVLSLTFPFLEQIWFKKGASLNSSSNKETSEKRIFRLIKHHAAVQRLFSNKILAGILSFLAFLLPPVKSLASLFYHQKYLRKSKMFEKSLEFPGFEDGCLQHRTVAEMIEQYLDVLGASVLELEKLIPHLREDSK